MAIRVPATARATSLAGLLVAGGIRAVYQPIVELDGGRPVACEALAQPIPADLVALVQRARGQVDVVVELTERALTDDPATLLAHVARLRAAGFGVALDDVGADPRSLALMPFVRPDVIKPDLRLVQAQPSLETAAIVHAVNAEAERSGARVLAEGIETREHLEMARALGADLGQGWLFGRPEPAPPAIGEGGRPLILGSDAPAGDANDTPFELVAARRPVRRGTKRLLLAISRRLEEQALLQGDSGHGPQRLPARHPLHPPHGRPLRPPGRDSSFVAALAHDLPRTPAPGVRGVALRAVDPLRAEWNVTVVGAHFAAAFVARDLGDDGSDGARRFDFCITYERDLVIRAAQALLVAVDPVRGTA